MKRCSAWIKRVEAHCTQKDKLTNIQESKELDTNSKPHNKNIGNS